MQQIRQRDVNGFCVFHDAIPKCEFSLRWSGTSPPARLKHRINLKGTTHRECQHFILDYVSDSQLPHAQSASYQQQEDSTLRNETKKGRTCSHCKAIYTGLDIQGRKEGMLLVPWLMPSSSSLSLICQNNFWNNREQMNMNMI